jgi:hypothetical protein
MAQDVADVTRLPPLLLIAGIPGAGKSHFGTWLGERGFTYIENDRAGGKARTSDLEAKWLDRSDVTAFLAAASRHSQPVVVEYGFAPHEYPHVASLVEGGASAWWFDGDRDAARAEYLLLRLARGLAQAQSAAAFDLQIRGIDAYWPHIEPVFEGRIIRTVTRVDGRDVHLPAPEIVRRILGS